MENRDNESEYDEEDVYIEDDIDYDDEYDYKLVDVKHEELEDINFRNRHTSNIMTLFEKVEIIGHRAAQLANGAIPLVDINTVSMRKNDPNPYFAIAEKELDIGVLPFIIRRKITHDKNNVEYWLPEQLVDIN